ncbi:uroporphyrinogen decarboxylase-like [Pocillopora damicornis]|uniref:uroporphyrinogen decarboxylase-like n=1 Tax=Pocillopora damicornis TaxID=46731 RepID=UPI000F554BDF|nr:uroporphyrinogen decarboxylase-like [Pocillopora damicornis]
MANCEVENGFPELKNDLILRAARGEVTERAPIWVMRQAGRYLPEFLKLKAENDADFFKMVQTPELACELTLQPIRRFPLDAAIIFSDILVIPQALGMTVQMIPGKGPVFPEPLREPSDIEKLIQEVDLKKTLGYVFQAITLTRNKLEGKVPLIGFTGAPWTLMCYMIEGESSKTFNKARKFLNQHLEVSSKLLQQMTDLIVDYLVLQVRAGAQMLQVFESHAEVIGYDTFMLCSLPYLKQIAEKVKEKLGPDAVPMTIFAKGAHYAIKDLSQIGYDVISLDWTMSAKDARIVAPTVTLQGNLDPACLYSSHEDIVHAVKDMLRKFGTQRYIANLGHGMHPDHEPEKLATFIDTVHNYSETLNERKMPCS